MSKHIAHGGQFYYVFHQNDPSSMWPYGVIQDLKTGLFYYTELRDKELFLTPIYDGEGLLPLGGGKHVVLYHTEVEELKNNADINKFIEEGLKLYHGSIPKQYL
tara:strand:- start:198 stop:509 length:312 start_codon:yes stop_codon:yes gene_type:complete